MNYFTHMPIFLNELVTPHAFSAYCTVYTYAYTKILFQAFARLMWFSVYEKNYLLIHVFAFAALRNVY